MTDSRRTVNAFGVHDARIHEFAGDGPIGINPSNEEGPETVILATFVHAEMRFKAPGFA
jgi:hypothetical protein